MPVRRILPLPLPLAFALLLLATALGAPAAQASGGDEVSLTAARLELKILAKKLGSAKSTNDELLGALDEVGRVYYSLASPPTPEYESVPGGALPATVRAIMARNRTLERRHAAVMKAFEREASGFRAAAAQQFLKAFRLTKLRGSPAENLRAPVNVKAAQVLGGLDDPKTAAALVRAIKGSILDAKYPVSSGFLEEAFAALGRQGIESSLKWLVDEFTHTKSSPPGEMDRLVAAHRAMILFPYEEISARGRFHVVDRMKTIYSGVESTARRGGASAAERSAKVLWDRIKDGVIQILQYYSGAPKNDAGEVLATVDEFGKWFRKHKNWRGSPWAD